MNTASKKVTGNPANVSLPDKFSLEQLFNFALELDECKKYSVVSINLGPKRYFSPFAMLFVAASIRSFNSKYPQCRTFIKNYDDHSYLAHMGFFDLCGVKFGKLMGEAPGNQDHIPITVVKRDQFYEKPIDKYTEIQDLIQRHTDRIAGIITREDPDKKDLFDVLSYSVREAIRNVFEHSGADEVYYCGQYWPTSNKVEVSVADLGMGIRSGLGTNPNFCYDTDKQAIEASLLSGVSGKTHLPRLSENWFNSGYGLYMTNRLERHPSDLERL